jgi:hypothetical protein
MTTIHFEGEMESLKLAATHKAVTDEYLKFLKSEDYTSQFQLDDGIASIDFSKVVAVECGTKVQENPAIASVQFQDKTRCLDIVIRIPDLVENQQGKARSTNIVSVFANYCREKPKSAPFTYLDSHGNYQVVVDLRKVVFVKVTDPSNKLFV